MRSFRTYKKPSHLQETKRLNFRGTTLFHADCPHALIASITGKPARAYYSCQIYPLIWQSVRSARELRGELGDFVYCLAPSGSSLANISLLLFLFNVFSIYVKYYM